MTPQFAATTLTFFAVFLGIFGINLVLNDIFEQEKKRRIKQFEEEFAKRERKRARDTVQDKLSLGQLAAEAQTLEETKTISEWLEDVMEQAGLRIPLRNIVLMALVLGVAVGIGMHFAMQNIWLTLLSGAAAASVPLLYVAYRRKKRLDTLRAQLPDSLELMSRVMRAGQTITQAMQAVSDEFKPPIATEFGYCYEQQNLGLAPELALRDLAKRTGLLEIKIFVLALLVHRQSGGNLAELLDKLSEIVRERFKILGKIRALTAEGRLQAAILLALPPFMYVVLLIISRKYALELLHHPNLIIGSIVFMILGALWIRKIVNFDF